MPLLPCGAILWRMLNLTSFVLPLFLSIAASTSIDVGSVAPDFSVTDIDGKPQQLAELTGKGPVVLVFFPKANTSGCTQELHNLTLEAANLQKHGAQVIAISGDTQAALKSFKSDLHATFAFVADDKGELMKAYNAKMPLIRVAKRRTFVIGRDKHIALVVRDQDAITLKGVQQALEGMSPLSGAAKPADH